METIKSTEIGTTEQEEILLAQTDVCHFEPLYHKYFNRVFRYVYQRMERREDAADLTANVFLRAMTGLRSYSSNSNPFLSWLFVIARNEVAGYYRKKKTEQRFFASKEGISRIATDAEYEVSEGFFTIRNALELLPDKDFELIELKYFNDKSIREISEITGINENNIRVQLHRIRQKIEKIVRSKTADLTLLVSIIVFSTILI